jgi:hypothetical protein
MPVKDRNLETKERVAWLKRVFSKNCAEAEEEHPPIPFRTVIASPETFWEISQEACRLDDYVAEIAAYQMAIRLGSDRIPLLYSMMGFAYEKQGHFETALACYVMADQLGWRAPSYDEDVARCLPRKHDLCGREI